MKRQNNDGSDGSIEDDVENGDLKNNKTDSTGNLSHLDETMNSMIKMRVEDIDFGNESETEERKGCCGQSFTKILITTIITCLLLIFSVRLLSEGIQGRLDMIHGKQAESTETDINQVIAAANSATGTVFDSKVIRTFNGKRSKFKKSMKKLEPLLTKKCSRWGVVTTIFDPNESISRIVEMPSWCLVIVPDTKTPDDYMDKLRQLMQKSINPKGIDNIFFFDIKKQKEWEKIHGSFGDFVSSTPWRHFCRKNIGYLFAILHGAQFIFDFDDDNFVKLDESGKPLQIMPDGEDPTKMILEDVSVVMNGPEAFNHHPIMQASIKDSWARGFPISLIQDKHTQGKVAFDTNLPFAANGKEIGVIQFLADGNPDIDAIHRLAKPLPMTFPLKAKSVLVPTHAYAPYNAQATIHTRNALFATLLPGTVPGRVSDIWRSYFAKCIFADTGLQLIFAPPKIVQERNEHNYIGDFNAEQDLYAKSEKLIEFLSEWDCEYETVPERMEQLWVDLYERGYIEVEDVHSVQKWLGALTQMGYEFPPLKRRFRNVAVMGQFNSADEPSVVDDVLFWTQKQKERFVTVHAAAPFSNEHMAELEKHSIMAVKSSRPDKGLFSPLENQMNLLLDYKDSDVIEGVIYLRDDGIMNVTELSEEKYPFPTDKIIADDDTDILSYKDVRKFKDEEVANQFSYRIYPDGHLEDFMKSHRFNNIKEMYEGLPLHQWESTPGKNCGIGQTELAKDPASSSYREKDGSLLFSSMVQADFLFVPTKYADEFAKAAQLHLDHRIFTECAYGTVVDMLRQKAHAKVRITHLCTNRNDGERGSVQAMDKCVKDHYQNGLIHPFKLKIRGYKSFSDVTDSLQ